MSSVTPPKAKWEAERLPTFLKIVVVEAQVDARTSIRPRWMR